MSSTPYSDQWREHVRGRMSALDIDRAELVAATGLPNISVIDALWPREPAALSLEVVGPIDELLDMLEAEREARALEVAVVMHPGVGCPTVKRVDVDLDAASFGHLVVRADVP